MAKERMCRQRFLQECEIAGVGAGFRGPEIGEERLELYAELWKRIEKFDDQLRQKEGPPPRPPPTSVPGPGVPRG